MKRLRLRRCRALGIESDDVANYCFPKTWPEDHEQRGSLCLLFDHGDLADILAKLRGQFGWN